MAMCIYLYSQFTGYCIEPLSYWEQMSSQVCWFQKSLCLNLPKLCCIRMLITFLSQKKKNFSRAWMIESVHVSVLVFLPSTTLNLLTSSQGRLKSPPISKLKHLHKFLGYQEFLPSESFIHTGPDKFSTALPGFFLTARAYCLTGWLVRISLPEINENSLMMPVFVKWCHTVFSWRVIFQWAILSKCQAI